MNSAVRHSATELNLHGWLPRSVLPFQYLDCELLPFWNSFINYLLDAKYKLLLQFGKEQALIEMFGRIESIDQAGGKS